MLRLNNAKIDKNHWMNLGKSLNKYKVADRFLNEDECEEAVFQSIWELGYECPKCNSEGKVWTLKTRRMYQCTDCSYQYSSRSRTPLRRKRVSFLRCFEGAEWIIATMAVENPAIMTIDKFRGIVLLSYRSARTLRLEMFEELQKPLGGFWGRLICTDEVEESFSVENRLAELIEHYDFDDLKAPFTKLGK